MRMFIDNGDYKFLLEDSKSYDLKNITTYSKSIVVVVTMDGEQEGDDERKDNIIKMSKDIIKTVMGFEYFDQVICLKPQEKRSSIQGHVI